MGDFVRGRLQGDHYACHTQRNVKWLEALVTAVPAWAEEGVESNILSPDSRQTLKPADLGSAAAWGEYARDPDAAWARRYAAQVLDIFPAMLDQAAAFDLVVGFELPPVVKRELDKRKVRYLSLHIHALRMARDLCFGATTNDLGIAALLATVELPPEEVQRQAGRFKALASFHRPPALAFPAGLPVLVGQTAHDSILIEKGCFADWHNHEDELASALHGHDTCIFIEHPYRPDSRSVCEYLRCRHGKNVVATNANGYGLLLSTADIPLVLTLSSSLGVEAQAFGLHSQFLLGDPRQRLRVAGLDLSSEAPLGHGVLSNDFWRAVLRRPAGKATSGGSSEPLALGEHYLRDSLDGWSYQLLRQRLVGARSRKNWMPARAWSAEQQTSITSALAAGQPDVEFVHFDAPLVPGERRRLRGADAGFAALLGNGFHAPGGWGVWSQPGRSELIVPVQAKASGTLHLALEVRCFEGLLDRCPVLEVLVEDRLCAAVMFRPVSSRSARVEVHTAVKAGPVWFTLLMTDAESPLETGLGEDPRRLGFGLTQIDLALLEETAPTTSQALSVWGIPSAAGEYTVEPLLLNWQA